MTSPSTSPNKHLVLILCTRAPLKTRFTISRLRAHLRKLLEVSPHAKKLAAKAKEQGVEYHWEALVHRVHFIGVEADLCDLKSVYALADKLVNGTVGSPDATTMDGLRLPHGSPGTSSYSAGVQQDRWALSQKAGSTGAQRSWGWGLSGLKIPRLDVVILNAGMGGWIGVDWIPAFRDILLDLVDAVTWPTFKLPNVGAVVKPQLSSKGPKTAAEDKQPLLLNQEKMDEPPLGEVFCSNVFGHYILSHELMPLLCRPSSATSQVGGKIMWISSIEALSDMFSVEDIQGLKSLTPYESTKRLSDLLALTATLPSVQNISAPFFDPVNTTTASKNIKDKKSTGNGRLVKPRMYTTQPGIFASEIMPLNWFLVACYKLVFLIARWLGSPWHTISPYKSAVAPVWVALTENETLEDMGGAKIKWGSSTDSGGNERVKKTEIEGWGWDGEIGATDDGERRKGRRKGAVDLTKEMREDFEILGGKCWTEMEHLRKEWEGVLGVGGRK
ncbi:3-keto-steroid reductase [Hyphodiscus hymeniophilus]|uniref:3-keto-steroid reductase n=1 Tax=Hyphodiscus hymeniophilus TaxID=353542 RepID=A0A9P7AWT1_9HELO|nr:3-keto-steroid reductase [Hyphodiscus hymeniophilus]